MGTRFIARSRPMREAVARAEALASGRRPVVIVGERGTGRRRLARRLHGVRGRQLEKLELDDPRFTQVRSARELWDRTVERTKCATLVAYHLDSVPSEVMSALRHRLRSSDGPRLVLTSAVDVEATVLGGDRRWYETIELPPLRGRTDEMPDLFAEFVAAEGEALGRTPPLIGFGVIDAIEAYRWPGNLTELRSIVRRALVVTRGRDRIEVDDLPVALRRAAREAEGMTLVPIEQLVRNAIVEAHRRLDGRRAAMARALGLSERTLNRKLRSYGLARPRPRLGDGCPAPALGLGADDADA